MLKCEIYLYHVYGTHTNFLEDFENTSECSYNLFLWTKIFELLKLEEYQLSIN